VKINKPISIKPKMKKRSVENFVANFISVLFTYKTQKPQQDDRSVTTAPATLTAHLLSTLFEISR